MAGPQRTLKRNGLFYLHASLLKLTPSNSQCIGDVIERGDREAEYDSCMLRMIFWLDILCHAYVLPERCNGRPREVYGGQPVSVENHCVSPES